MGLVLVAIAALLVGVLPSAAGPGEGGGAASSEPNRQALTRAALAAKDRALDDLSGTDAVVGAGIGADSSGRPTVAVLVESDDAAEGGIPDSVDGVPVEVVVTGRFVAETTCPPAGPDEFCDRPVPAGVSVGHPDVTAGTIGAVVSDGTDTYILGNNHILADENAASIGDTILQPGVADGGSLFDPADHIGTLADFEPLQFCTGPCGAADPHNTIDAAIAEVDPADVDPETFCGWEPSSTVLPEPQVTIGLAVHKCGRTTVATSNLVAFTDVDLTVEYDSGSAWFVDQLIVGHSGGLFSAGGDSGSLIVDDHDRPVALLHAGSSTFTAANPIVDVLDRFGVAVVGDPYVAPTTTTTPKTTTTAKPTTTTTPQTTTTRPVAPPQPARSGYWMVDRAGTIYGFGDASAYVPIPGIAVSIDARRDGRGVWVLDESGVVHTRGTATHHGDVDLTGLAPGERVTSLSATPDGRGYWVFTDRGRALAFGDAAFFGDMTAVPLNGPVIASVATPSGRGYYMIASDGGVFTFGDAAFWGSTGDLVLNEPVVGVAPDPDHVGYWLTASDGGMFSFAANFRGSMGGIPLNQPVIGAVAFGDGYLLVAADGGIFTFSSEPFFGSLGASPPPTPVVGVAAFTT